jgi:hypothetical protein
VKDVFARFLLENLLGYEDVLMSSVKSLAEKENNKVSLLISTLSFPHFFPFLFFFLVGAGAHPVLVEPVLRIQDVYPGSEFLPSRIRICSIPDLHQRISILTQKNFSKLLEI